MKYKKILENIFNCREFKPLSDDLAKIILIKNNKGGVGKSWIAFQIAHALQLKTGKKILILTTDSQNNILHYAGKENVEFNGGLEEWINGKDGEIISIRENVYFIPLMADYIKPSSRSKLVSFIEALKQRFEYIIIDSTPTLSLDKDFLELTDEIIIPTFLDNVTTASIVNLLNQVDKKKVKAIIPNRFTRTAKEKEIYNSLVDILGGTGILLTMPISQSGEIGKLIDKGKSVWESKSAKTEEIREIFLKIIEVICNE